MASKTKPPTKPGVADSRPDETVDSATAPNPSSARRLVSRIAQALQISEAALFNPHDTLRPPRRTDEIEALEAGLDAECAALLSAYRRIGDPEVRLRVQFLVREAAE